MVEKKSIYTYSKDKTIDVPTWLHQINELYHPENLALIQKAALLTAHFSAGLTTFYGQPCLEQGLDIAEIILQLKLDPAAVAASMLTTVMAYAHVTPDKIATDLNLEVAALLKGVNQMESLREIQKNIVQKHDYTQIDRMRKMILALVNDVRVVLILLAKQTVVMNGIKDINPGERKRIAEETRDIYAPLANRLGIGQLKWELEDLSLRYIDPTTYKSISHFLAERRGDREIRIQAMILNIREHLEAEEIEGDVQGRAKHINSIYNKMLAKNLTIKNIYDISAIRIVVPSIQDCYRALSIVHKLWEHVPEEFDDYIATPKPNGYRSIHTAVIGSDGKNYEIQIRTHEMHEESERGIAAHWLYKEDKSHHPAYQSKINFLRQLLDWHREVSNTDNKSQSQNDLYSEEDQIYILTPAGKIIDLPFGSTPVDFAYSIHTDVGHHCRGAKVQGRIVPLSYTLQTGDQVEIITISEGGPSRDWLNVDSGYVKSSRARSKIAQWFKQEDSTRDIEAGKNMIEKEASRLKDIDLVKAAQKLHLKDTTALLAALGRGSIKISHLGALPKEATKTLPTHDRLQSQSGAPVSGTKDFLTRIAHCCKPIPPEEIIGYITYGRGISIHRKNCHNLKTVDEARILTIHWDETQAGSYAVDLEINALFSHDLLKEITSIFSNSQINIIAMRSLMGHNQQSVWVSMTIQIHDFKELTQVIHELKQLPLIIEVKRKT